MLHQLSSLLAFSLLATAAPTPAPQDSSTDGPGTYSCDLSQSPFYLVTTPSPICTSNSSNIPLVSATSLFDPARQTNFLLRTIGPGYGSLPTFTFSAGTLHTFAADNFGQGNYSYAAAAPQQGVELQFVRDEASSGGGDAGLDLTAGYLLGVGGVTDQWTLCAGALGQVVIKWQGGDGCNATYIQAVAAPPY